MRRTLFQNMILIDGSGNTPVHRASMLVDDGMLREISCERPNITMCDELVDLAGKYVVPGIIDCHVHGGLNGEPGCLEKASAASEAETAITYMNNLRKLLSDGVVFFREMGTKHHVDIAAAQAVAGGEIAGPGILPCGDLLTITGGHCWGIGLQCDGAVEVTKAVRAQIKAGAQAIKFMASGGLHTPRNRSNAPQFSAEELAAGIREARKFGLVTGAHCMDAVSARYLLTAGIDSIEHGCFLCEDEAVFDIMAMQGAYYVPTIHAVEVIADSDPALGLSKELLSKSIPAHNKHIDSFQLALKKGVKIAFGTDRGTTLNHFQSGSVEALAMNRYGMPAADIITSFSKTASELLGISREYGTLEPGKRANFLVVDRDPIKDISVLTGAKQVYLNGVRQF